MSVFDDISLARISMVPLLPATALFTKSTGALMSRPPASCSLISADSELVRARFWMRGRSDWGRAKETLMGWISVMVTSADVLAPAAAVT